MYYDTNTQLGKRLIREGLTHHHSKVNVGNIIQLNKMADYIYLMVSNDQLFNKRSRSCYELSNTECRAMEDSSIKKYYKIVREYGAPVAAAMITPYYKRTLFQKRITKMMRAK